MHHNLQLIKSYFSPNTQYHNQIQTRGAHQYPGMGFQFSLRQRARHHIGWKAQEARSWITWTWLVSSTLTHTFIHLSRNDNIWLNQVKLQNWYSKITSTHHPLQHNPVYEYEEHSKRSRFTINTLIKLQNTQQSQNVKTAMEDDNDLTKTRSISDGHTLRLWVRDPVRRINTLGEIRPES